MRNTLVMNIYDYTLEPTLPYLSANSGSLRQSPGLRRFRAPGQANVVPYFPRPDGGYKHDFTPDFRIVQWKSRCRKSKRCFLFFSWPGYFGSRSSFRWESKPSSLEGTLKYARRTSHACGRPQRSLWLLEWPMFVRPAACPRTYAFAALLAWSSRL